MTTIVQQPVHTYQHVQAQLVLAAATENSSAILSPDRAGVYDIWCDTDVFVIASLLSPGCNASTGYLVRAGTTIPFYIPMGLKIWAFSTAGGTLRYMRSGHAA